jgi:aminoglycoside phosphotransferase (APT) family kinase protein
MFAFNEQSCNRNVRFVSQYPNYAATNMQHVQTVVAQLFPACSPQIERVAVGVSTYVYRIFARKTTWYLRVLPEEGASFTPEAEVHARLRQAGVRVPEVIFVEPYNELLQRSLMLTTEIPGQPLAQSQHLGERALTEIVRDAGRDLARINSLPVAGFGWVKRDLATPAGALQAEWPTYRAFIDEYWEADLRYLANHVLSTPEIVQLEHVLALHDGWLDLEQGRLVHGDFDVTHIYQDQGRYSGIIDFGEIRGADRWYDLAQFHMREWEQLPWPLESALLRGYEEITPLPTDYEAHIRFTALLTSVRALARSLQKRPPNSFTHHMLQMLRANLARL